MAARKIFVPGTVLCTLEKEDVSGRATIVECTIKETVVSILEETGNYEVIIFTDSGEIPWFIVHELHRDGLLWIKGHEKFAAKLREIRAKQKIEREENWWSGLLFSGKIHYLEGESTVLKELLIDNDELVRMIHSGKSKAECLKFINENF